MPKVIDRYNVPTLLDQGAQLVDVLGVKEYEAEHLPRAINIPLKTFDRQTTRRLDSRRPVIVYCHDYQ
jgi:rhodanese-related sulfurtransferase